VAALIAGYAIYYATGSQTTNSCLPGQQNLQCVYDTVKTPTDAKPLWLAAGVAEALTIVVAFGVSASARRKS
jgi:hypothetical protein